MNLYKYALTLALFLSAESVLSAESDIYIKISKDMIDIYTKTYNLPQTNSEILTINLQALENTSNNNTWLYSINKDWHGKWDHSIVTTEQLQQNHTLDIYQKNILTLRQQVISALTIRTPSTCGLLVRSSAYNGMFSIKYHTDFGMFFTTHTNTENITDAILHGSEYHAISIHSFQLTDQKYRYQQLATLPDTATYMATMIPGVDLYISEGQVFLITNALQMTQDSVSTLSAGLKTLLQKYADRSVLIQQLIDNSSTDTDCLHILHHTTNAYTFLSFLTPEEKNKILNGQTVEIFFDIEAVEGN